MSSHCPKRPAHLAYQELPEENELMVVDEAKGEARVLNADAGGVWLLCDGTRGASEMLAILREAFPEMEEETLEKKLVETIRFLKDEGLLE